MMTAYMANLLSWRQMQAREMQALAQSFQQLGQAFGGALKGYAADQQADTAANTVVPPRAALVSPNPSDPDQEMAMDEFQAQNPNMDTSGSAPYTGGARNLHPYIAAQGQLGRQAQPYVPGQNPVTDLQRARALRALHSPNLGMNPGGSTGGPRGGYGGYAAQSKAALPSNMAGVMTPDQLAGAPADQVSAATQGVPQTPATPLGSAAGAAKTALSQADGTMKFLSGGKIPSMAIFESVMGQAHPDPASGAVNLGGTTFTKDQWLAMMNQYNSVHNAGKAATTAIGSQTPPSSASFYFGAQNQNPQTSPMAQDMGNPQTSEVEQDLGY